MLHVSLGPFNHRRLWNLELQQAGRSAATAAFDQKTTLLATGTKEPLPHHTLPGPFSLLFFRPKCLIKCSLVETATERIKLPSTMELKLTVGGATRYWRLRMARKHADLTLQMLSSARYKLCRLNCSSPGISISVCSPPALFPSSSQTSFILRGTLNHHV